MLDSHSRALKTRILA